MVLHAGSRCRRPIGLVLAACGGLASPVFAQTAGQRPPALPVIQLDDRARAADLDAPRTISLTISQPIPLLDMLVLLVRGTPFSIVADDRVEGTFSGELKDLTMRQAIESVLFARDLDYDVQGSLIRVFPRKPVTRLFEVNYLNLRRTWQRGIRATVAIPGQPPAAESSTTMETDLLEELGNGVQVLLSASGRLHLDRTAGIVQVTDFADRLDQIGLYVEAVQVRATRQVRLEARVFEVTMNDPASTSIDWNAVVSRAGTAIQGGLAPSAAGMRVDDFPALMKAIAEQGTVKVIAAPHMIAMNNEPAIMRVGIQEVYFVPASQVDEAGRTERVSNPATIAQGLTLTVIPQIAADGIVLLSVAPTYAEKTGEAKASKGQSAPVLSVSEAETLVRVHDGDTVVVAGFLQDRTKAPANTGMRGIFRSAARETVKSELVILLTPTVVTPGASRSTGSR
jgi:MSHA biogenesis protein MshL